MKWQDRRLLDLFGIDHPILQAPMAGASSTPMAIAVSEAGGLGAVAAAMLTPDTLRTELQLVRQATSRSVNVNFFVHKAPAADAEREANWRKRLAPYYRELGLPPDAGVGGPVRAPFDSALCEVVLEYKPRVVSFHFGLPEAGLVRRLKDGGIVVIGSATSAEEARWLEAGGCDAIIAQGAEAGGHRGMFLNDDISRQAGTMALVPQVVDAVKVPVIAAGGIGDGRGIAAALALGAAGAQIGTGFLLTPEAKISALHRAALRQAHDNSTALTNVFTGRPARGIVNRYVREVGPMSPDAPAFPLAAGAAHPLRAASEPKGSTDFTPLWSGQAPTLAREMPTSALVAILVEEAAAAIARLA
ncbi:nitronate monooxygenase [Enhydrobacter sp.]|uniref:NAD(P)H-dependent flavin oxidoreductase n=1 Tax=Enhydrobacter sp. TaxID=1894999 RepID=UPI002628BE5F|nr:nitronate monooxygenase [Enhydrobacter sp.]WIM14083.1 MAG: putative oxidoreductase, nitronate monooxygenase family [Enhydrobacter sp.]